MIARIGFLVLGIAASQASAQAVITEVFRYRQNQVYQSGELVLSQGYGPGDAQPDPYSIYSHIFYPEADSQVQLWAVTDGWANLFVGEEVSKFDLMVGGSISGYLDQIEPAELHSTASIVLRLTLNEASTVRFATKSLGGSGSFDQPGGVEDPNPRSEASLRILSAGPTIDTLFERKRDEAGYLHETVYRTLNAGDYLFEVSALAQIDWQDGAPEAGLDREFWRAASVDFTFEIVPTPSTGLAFTLAGLTLARRRRR